jgi:hypothetical protein
VETDLLAREKKKEQKYKNEERKEPMLPSRDP